ncbi:MAG: T9SS type A sorting domain-containing protein, partial [Bacteroidota bacterium]|nr:T9SS type A sorting domain-containing protein [Bacteroidota bacterium]
SFAQNSISQHLPPAVQTDTTNGWQLVFSNPKYQFEFLQFPSRDTGYAVASDLTKLILLRTTNQGIKWDSVSLPPVGIFTFTTTQVGYSAVNSNIVYKTIDGGRSWQAHDRNSVAYGPIAFVNADTGFVFGSCCMARTTDAGETWNEAFPPNDINKTDASFADSKVGYVVGESTGINDHPDWPFAGYCQKTTDGGTTWQQIYTGVSADIGCCEAIDENTIIVASSAMYVGRSTNGGMTWDTASIVNKKSGFFAMSFADKSHGVIVGNDDATGINPHGIIFATTDTGKSWQRQYLPNAPSLYGVSVLNDSVAVVCGGGNIYRTSNGGNFSSVSHEEYDFKLHVFPNPARTSITFQYQLPNAESLSIRVYDEQGVSVGNLNVGIQSIGENQTVFDASALANGKYFAGLLAGKYQQVASFIIQK